MKNVNLSSERNEPNWLCQVWGVSDTLYFKKWYEATPECLYTVAGIMLIIVASLSTS